MAVALGNTVRSGACRNLVGLVCVAVAILGLAGGVRAGVDVIDTFDSAPFGGWPPSFQTDQLSYEGTTMDLFCWYSAISGFDGGCVEGDSFGEAATITITTQTADPFQFNSIAIQNDLGIPVTISGSGTDPFPDITVSAFAGRAVYSADQPNLVTEVTISASDLCVVFENVSVTIAVPEIDLERPESAPIADGGTDAQGTVPAGEQVVLTYTVKNPGDAELSVDEITSTSASNVAVDSIQPTSLTIDADESATFDVRYTPTSGGAYSFELDIVSNDADEANYDITVSGTATAPEMDLKEQDAGWKPDGFTHYRGWFRAGCEASATYEALNTGDATLEVTDITFDSESNVSVGTIAPTNFTVEPAGSVPFDVPHTPTSDGGFSFSIHIANNDSDENPYDLTVTGKADGTPPVTTAGAGPSGYDNASDPTFAFTAADSGSGLLSVSASLSGVISAGPSEVASYPPVVHSASEDFDLSEVLGRALATDGSEDGVYTMSVVSTDKVGIVESTATWNWTYDSQAPAKPATPELDAGSDLGESSTDNITNDNTPRIEVGPGGVEPYALVWITSSRDGVVDRNPAYADGSWYRVITSPGLSEGAHVLTITAEDGAGNVSPPSDGLSILIDTTPPTVPTGLDPADGTYTDDTGDTTPPLTLSWNASSDSGGSGLRTTDTYRYVVDGGSSGYTANTEYEPALGEGAYVWKVRARDIAGNNSDYTADTRLYVDTTDPIDPTVESTSHVVGVLSNDATVDIVKSVDASDPLSNGVSAGVDGFDYAWDKSATWTATEAKDHEESWTGGTFEATSDGDWYFHIATVDNAGNWTSTEDLGPFPIDTTPPDVSSVTPSDPLISDADTGAGKTFTVTVTFPDDMKTDGSADPVLTFAPAVGSTLSGASGGWNGTTDTYTVTYGTVADGGVDEDSVTIDVTGAQDAVGNYQADYTPEHEFEIDTENPTVISFWQNDTLLTDADVGAAMFEWVAVFSESMSGPRLGVSYWVYDYSLTWSPDSWSSTNVNRDTFTHRSNVHDENATWIDRDIRIYNDTSRPTTHCVYDSAGNSLTEYWVYDAFTIDTENPLPDVTVSDLLISDADTGVGKTFTVTVTFPEDMTTDGSADPSLTFDPAVGSTLGGASGSWNGTTDTYTVVYSTVSDAGVDEDSVTIDVTGAKDANGNDQADYTPEHEFEIDTENPTILSVGVNDTLVTDADAGPTLTFTIVFSETMVGDKPNLHFTPPVLPIWPDSDLWSDTNVTRDTYEITYDVNPNQEIEAASVDVLIKELPPNYYVTDSAGNEIVEYTETDVMAVDTMNPTVVSVFCNDSRISDSDDGNTTEVYVWFSEQMKDDGSADPTFIFSPDVSATLEYITDLGWGFGVAFGGSIYGHWFRTWDVNVDVDSVTIDVEGGVDQHGNLMVNYTPEHEIEIDTLNPTITSIASSAPDGYYGLGAPLDVTVNFSEDVTLAGGTLNVTLDTGAVVNLAPFGPASSTSGTYTVGASDNSCDLDAIAVTLGGGATLRDKVLFWNDADIFLPATTIADGSDITVDTTDPTITWISGFPDTTQNMDSDCTLEFPIEIRVTDNCCIDVGDVDFTVSDSGNATFADTLEKVQISPTRVDIAGTVTVSNLTSCPATVDLDIDAEDCTGNTSTLGDSVTVSDSTGPTYSVIQGFPFGEQSMDEDCSLTFPIEILVADNCRIDEANVTVTVSDPADATVTDTLAKAQEGANAVRITGNMTISSLTDGESTVSVDVTSSDCCGNGGSLSHGLTVVDDSDPTISGLSVTSDDGLVDGACEEVVEVYAVVRDNCCISAANIIVTPSIANALLKDSNIVKTQDTARQVTISGTIVVYSLTDCPATIEVEIDATDCGGNNDSWSDDAQITDEIAPTINDLEFNTDATYTVRGTDFSVDNCCSVRLYFSANVTDNCCVRPDRISIMFDVPAGNAELLGAGSHKVQNGPNRVDVTGYVDVGCLTSCPARAEIGIVAMDCCGNASGWRMTTEDEGLVWDTIASAPRDDPRQDMVMDESAVIDPLVEVRLDGAGVYRLVVREDTPVRLDIMANDADNCSCENCAHSFDPCGSCGECSGCCAALTIHEIVDQPAFGTATIEDDTGDCGGGSAIRYAPNTGYTGPDEFTYKLRDACGNVSAEAKVWMYVASCVTMEDVYVTACSGEPTEFTVSATDPWVDREDVELAFSLIDGPANGVVVGDPSLVVLTPSSTIDIGGEPVPTLDFCESAEVALTYTSAAGFTGRDAIMIRFEDPFGNFATARVDISVMECVVGRLGIPGIEVTQGVILPLIVPETFESVVETTWGSVLLILLADGTEYPAALSVGFNEEINRHVIYVDTRPVPVGRYLLSVPLGNGETVTLMIEVEAGEAE